MPTPLFDLDLDEHQLLRIEVADTNTRQAQQKPGKALTAASEQVANAPFHTNGWDTVYAIRLTDVNRAIATKGTSPRNWSATIPKSRWSPQVDATGSFDTWSLSNGAGSGSSISLHVPFTARVTLDDEDIDVTGGVAYVSVKLIYLPQPNSGDHQALLVRSSGGSADDPVVLVNSVTYPSPAPDEGLTTKLTELLRQWFNANLQAFTHVFATVNLGMEAAEDAFKWLYPTYTTYAYHDAATLDDALLGVLCMTEGRDITGTDQELAAGAIPGSARAGFSISAERFLNKMVLPSLMAEFTKAEPNTFQPYSTRIEATTPIPLKGVPVAGVKYYPQITKFRVNVENDQLITYAFIHTPISPGIDVYAELTYNVSIVLGTKSDGTQSLTYREVSTPEKRTWHTIAPWVEGVEITASFILSIIAAVVTWGAAAITNVILKVIVAALVGGVVGAIVWVLEKIPEWIAGSVPDALPSVDALVTNATASTEWADGKGFELTTALFNGALQFGGNPGFSTS